MQMNQNQVVGSNIKRFRERMGLTQDALAGFLGIPREQISYWESGARTISTSHLSKMADLFCLDDYAFYEEEKSEQDVNLAFAFRADGISANDLENIAAFKRVVKNYLSMKKMLRDV
jgi:transcriptional regulator with XRE-family HTH domain